MATINVTSNTDLAGIYLCYPNSVSNEEPGFRGYTHILEHLMLNGTKHKTDWDRLGLLVNGETWSSGMSLYLTGLSESLDKTYEEFYNLVNEVEITPSLVKKEVEIIKNEYLESTNSVDSASFYNLMNYYKLPNAIGDINDLNSVTYEKVMEFKSKYLSSPGNIVFIHPHSTMSLSISTTPLVRNYKYVPCNNISVPRHSGYKYLTIGFQVTPDNVIYLKIFQIIMTSNFSSVLMDEFRTKRSLVYSTPADMALTDSSSGILVFMLQLTDANYAEGKKLLSDILKNIKSYITKESFEYFIDVISSGIKISNVTNYLNYQKYYCPQEYLLDNYLDKITYSEFINKINGLTYQLFVEN